MSRLLLRADARPPELNPAALHKAKRCCNVVRLQSNTFRRTGIKCPCLIKNDSAGVDRYWSRVGV